MRAGNRVSGWEERLIDGLIELVSRLGEEPVGEKKDRPKFVGYDDLLKVMERPECPACYIVRRSLQGFLSIAFIEELTVPEFREPVRSSFGYCKLHSEYVRVASRNRLRKMGVAIVYEDLLALVQDSMRAKHEVPVVSGCPLCRLQEDVETYAVQIIADYCNDAEFQNHYEASSGVCLPHLREVFRLLEGDARKFVVESHLKKLETQLGHLQEFIRKHDYRFTHEKMTEEEKTSPRSAVRFVAGY
jgi:hypothetical protein